MAENKISLSTASFDGGKKSEHDRGEHSGWNIYIKYKKVGLLFV